MLSYNLRCEKDHEFEGWFPNRSGFESQRDNGEIECPICGTTKVEQALSLPNISSTKMQTKTKAEEAVKIREAMLKLRKHVETTHENVGTQFAEEARKMHYGETETRDIYGEATGEEAQDLLDEGIAVAPLPWIEEAKEN